MKLTQVGSKVIFKRLPDREVSQGGIVLPNAGVRRTCRGEVLSCPVNVADGGVLYSQQWIALSKHIDKLDVDYGQEIYWVEFAHIIAKEESNV